MSDLMTVSEIYSFCQRTGITTARFCQDAIGDSHYLAAISNGRAITTQKTRQMRRFMAERDARLQSAMGRRGSDIMHHPFQDGYERDTRKGIEQGSMALCKAIFATGKVHGPIPGITVGA